MDLYDYLQVLRQRWLIAVFGLLLTTALTVVFVNQQPFVYESKGTLVIRPRTQDSGDGLRAIDALIRGVEIPSTFATITRSDEVRQRAEQRLDDSVRWSRLTVSCEVLTSTSILEVTVRGGDPQATYALADAVTSEAVDYVRDLQQVYELRPLDAPRVPNKPVAPNRPLIIGTGLFLGIGVAMVFAVLAEGYARRPKARHFDSELSEALQPNTSYRYRYGSIETTRDDGSQARYATNGDDAGTADDRAALRRTPRRAAATTPATDPRDG
jgi:capsular polysaccharide biosynthesis protein